MFTLLKQRPRRSRTTGRRRRGGPPVLVAVAYSAGAWVELTFDRAIDLAALDAAKVTVGDATTGDTYRGAAPVTAASPRTVRVALQDAGPSAGPGVTLTVVNGAGIAAADGGAAWAGATTLPIPTAPAALVLVAAEYSAGEPLVLVFDRAVSVAGFAGGQVLVSDGGGEADATLAGTGGATLLDPVTVRVSLVPIGPPTGVYAELTATNATGIVAVDDGGTWVGVTGLELPFQ